jgi:hypothetical protein
VGVDVNDSTANDIYIFLLLLCIPLLPRKYKKDELLSKKMLNLMLGFLIPSKSTVFRLEGWNTLLTICSQYSVFFSKNAINFFLKHFEFR